MRQAQHNKRSRGRGRKSTNPGNRVYESNGPDVKVRGNASHIAEKYVNLARDANSSGDLVAAENYLQHAEHYFRLVAAAQSQIKQDQVQNRARQGGEQPNMRPPVEGSESGSDEADAKDDAPDRSGNDAGSEKNADQADSGRSAGRNRRPSGERRNAKSGADEDSASVAEKDQMTNGTDTGEDLAPEQVEVENITQSGEDNAQPEEVAQADADV